MNFRERYKYNPSTDKLGSGGFATVFKAEDTLLDREVALKIFHSSESSKVSLLAELKRMSRLDHPNLIRCLDILNVEVTNIHGQPESLGIGVMEYANGGSLKDFAYQNRDVNVSKTILIQILKGLAYLHQRGIIHRDLKPQNILLHKNEEELIPKITDFGISKTLSNETLASSVVMGTIEYMAPEQFNPQRYGINGRIATNLDLWSFGILTYELITGKNLFGGGDRNSSSEQVMNAILTFELPDDIRNVQEPYQTVIRRCLVADANERAKEAKELIEILKKPEAELAPQKKNYEGATVAIPKARVQAPEMPKLLKEQAAPPAILPDLHVQNPVQERQEHALPKNVKSKKKWIKPVAIALITILVIAISIYFYTSSGKKEGLVVTTNKAAAQKNLSVSKIDWEKEIGFLNAKPSKNKDSLMLSIYNRCAADGIAECQYQAAMMLLKKKSYAQVDSLSNKAADQNHIKALSLQAYLYYTGTGVKKDYLTAKKLYERAAEGNNSVALLMLGRIHREGKVVVKDQEKAKEYFERAIKANDDAAAVTEARKELISY